MMIKVLFAFVLSSFVLPFALANEAKGVCIVYLERDEHPVTEKLLRELMNLKKEGAAFFLGRNPQDLLSCASLGYTKILLVAHGGQIGPELDSYRLTNFTALATQEYEERKKNGLAAIQKLIETRRTEFKQANCDIFTDNPLCQPLETELRQFEMLQTKLDEKMLKLQFGYAQNILYRKFWSLFYQAYQSSPKSLKEIKLFSCSAEQMISSHGQLQQLEKQGVRITNEGKSVIRSFMMNKSVLSFDVDSFVREVKASALAGPNN